jgi:hypothetical protein
MEDVKSDLLILSDFAYARLEGRLAGLTDDEYLWEPAADVWTIRVGPDGKATGDWGVLFDEVPPVTTIAWRITHIIDCLSAQRCATWLGLDPEPSPLADGPPATAQAAIGMLARANDVWRGYVEAADAQTLHLAVGAIGGIYADSTRTGFILHIVDELIHHGAEVGLLRDLYRAELPRDPFIEACLKADEDAIASLRAADPTIVGRAIAEHPDLMLRAAAIGRWEAVPGLAELGFSVAGREGRTPLHHAAAANNVEAVRLLVELGADLDAVDPTYRSTPLGWAEYFGRTEAAEALRSASRASR